MRPHDCPPCLCPASLRPSVNSQPISYASDPQDKDNGGINQKQVDTSSAPRGNMNFHDASLGTPKRAHPRDKRNRTAISAHSKRASGNCAPPWFSKIPRGPAWAATIETPWQA
eukprot:4873233-Pyramimonas_sp.AAC.1